MKKTGIKYLAQLALDIDITDQTAVLEWRRLYGVYVNALQSPPLGIIGVGAITYAENKLRVALEC
jgi:hypothetical protein